MVVPTVSPTRPRPTLARSEGGTVRVFQARLVRRQRENISSYQEFVWGLKEQECRQRNRV